MMKATHTQFRKGQSVKVMLRNGDQFVDQFVERESKFVVLKEKGRVRTNQLRSMVINRGERK